MATELCDVDLLLEQNLSFGWARQSIQLSRKRKCSTDFDRWYSKSATYHRQMALAYQTVPEGLFAIRNFPKQSHRSHFSPIREGTALAESASKGIKWHRGAVVFRLHDARRSRMRYTPPARDSRSGSFEVHGAVRRHRALKTGIAGYPKDGLNYRSAGHLNDAAGQFRLVMEKGEPGTAYHAVGGQGFMVKELAERLGSFLGFPSPVFWRIGRKSLTASWIP